MQIKLIQVFGCPSFYFSWVWSPAWLGHSSNSLEDVLEIVSSGLCRCCFYAFGDEINCSSLLRNHTWIVAVKHSLSRSIFPNQIRRLKETIETTYCPSCVRLSSIIFNIFNFPETARGVSTKLDRKQVPNVHSLVCSFRVGPQRLIQGHIVTKKVRL